MTLLEIRTGSTIDLMNRLSEQISPEEYNMIIYELTCRMYVPFNDMGMSFDDLLLQNGYYYEAKHK
jgi:hypothetical protein